MKLIKKFLIKNNTKKTKLKVLYYECHAKAPSLSKPITKHTKKGLAPKGSKAFAFPSAFKIPKAPCGAA